MPPVSSHRGQAFPMRNATLPDAHDVQFYPNRKATQERLLLITFFFFFYFSAILRIHLLNICQSNFILDQFSLCMLP